MSYKNKSFQTMNGPDYKVALETFPYRDFVAIDVQGEGYVIKAAMEGENACPVVATGFNMPRDEAIRFAHAILKQAGEE